MYQQQKQYKGIRKKKKKTLPLETTKDIETITIFVIYICI